MSRMNNTIKIEGDLVTIFVTKDDDIRYLNEVLIDADDLHLIGKIYVKSNGYVWTNRRNLAHIIMSHGSNLVTVIDHKNGNKLDNRKINLRVLTQCDNANNRNSSQNNTGIVGIARRCNGNYEYFRVTVSDRKHPVKSGSTKSACKKYTKQFNINKLGEDIAFTQAQAWLSAKRKEFGYIDY